jgi:hypothetical protein
MKKNSSPEAYYDRLKLLGNVNKTSTKESQTRNLGTLIDYKRAADGVAYGIIKEQHLYYIKKSGLKQDPNVSDFAYITGLGNVTEYQYRRLAEADKDRNFLLHTINEAVNTKVSKTGSKKRLNEDKAGDEIEQAASKVNALDTATAAEVPAEVPAEPTGDLGGDEMAAGLAAEPPAPEGGEEMPPEGGEEMPPEGGEEMPPEGGEEMPPEGGEEMPPEGGEELAKGETVKELEKNLGKLTNTIRKTELEPSQTKGYLKSFIQSFKDKLQDLEIEERKEIADLLIKVVPPEDVEDLGTTVPQDDETGAEAGVEEQECAECGRFAEYAKSRGYDANSIRECGEEEVGNLVSGYANAYNDGQNDGDFDGVALVVKIVNPEILNKLKGDYGHDEYTEKLKPHVDGMNECTEEEGLIKLNELFGGLGSLAKGAFGGIKKGAQAVGGAVKGAAQNVAQKAQQAGQAIAQTYHAGEVSGEVKKLEAIGSDLGKQVAALNTRLQKAGQQPVNVQSILQSITSQIQRGGTPSIAGKVVPMTPNAPAMAAEGVIPTDNVQVQPNMLKEDDEELETPEHEAGETPDVEKAEDLGGGKEEKSTFFAPDAQVLGGGVVKPDGAPTTGVDITISPDKEVQISMNEAKQKLIKQIADGVNSYLSEAAKQNSKPFVTAPKGVKEGNAFTAKLEKTPKGGAFELGGEKKKDTSGYDKKTLEEEDKPEEKEEKSGKKKLTPAQEKFFGKKKDSEKKEDEKEEMSESERKLRKYIRNHLEEKAGLRKPSLNENKKSAVIKKLDAAIDEQFKLYEGVVLKKKVK